MKSIFRFFFSHPTALIALVIVFWIGTVVAYDIASRSVSSEEAFSPYVECTEGTTVVKRAEKRISLTKGNRASVFEGDQIKTLPNSKATLFWLDGSATRLSEKTSIDIATLSNERKTGKTKVDFSLNEGKTWTRTYRYLDNGSEFTERFDGGNKIAAVRGTSFEINADKHYLRTESHAVEILDLSGKSLKTVSEGQAVSTTNLSTFVAEGLDKAWKDSNIAEDAKYSFELASKTKEDILRSYSDAMSTYEKARNFVIPEEPLPVSVSFSGNSLIVDVPKDLASKVNRSKSNYERLLALYERTSKLPQDVETIRSKESLREALIEMAPESEKATLATRFARHGTYDSWVAAATGDEAELAKLKAGIAKFIDAGADREMLKKIENSLPIDKMDLFNSKMDDLKSKAVEIVSENGLDIPTDKDFKDAGKEVGKIFESIAR